MRMTTPQQPVIAGDDPWPELPLEAWQSTKETVHRWMQIVGKIRLALTPRINHWWNVPLYVTPRGFTTSSIPYHDRWFTIDLDFINDVMLIAPNDGAVRAVALGPRSVADVYRDTLATLRGAGLECHIWPMPVEIENPIRFDRDEQHRSYDKEYVLRFWRIVAESSAVLTKFRARFLGKSSPVQLFWGTLDLAVNRYSGRRAPPLDGNIIEREAYSHETHAVGWWPGDNRLPRPAFFSYAAPEPAGYAGARITTPHAYYHPVLKGFYLNYDDLRTADDPEALLLDFCQSTYAAAANLARWDRAALERPDAD
jgi:hypothetical protein